jgi:hypothetical protein
VAAEARHQHQRVQIAGILLFRIAVSMVLAAPTSSETREEEEEARSRPDVSVFPLAIPLIAGPGALASMMILVGEAGREPWLLAAVFAMAAAVLALTWLALRLASPLGRVLRRTGVNVGPASSASSSRPLPSSTSPTACAGSSRPAEALPPQNPGTRSDAEGELAGEATRALDML